MGASSLTLTMLRAAFDQARGLLYYGVSFAVPCGMVIQQHASPGVPKAIHCHPADLAYLSTIIPQRLVPIQLWQPTHEELIAQAWELTDRQLNDAFVWKG